MKRDPNTSQIYSIRCQFCTFCGKEDTIEEDKCKRAQTDIVKDWKAPFRPQLYRDHHMNKHDGSWIIYQTLSHEEKKTYFDNKVKYKDIMDKHFGISKTTHTIYYINISIVEQIISDLFFHPDE